MYSELMAVHHFVSTPSGHFIMFHLPSGHFHSIFSDMGLKFQIWTESCSLLNMSNVKPCACEWVKTISPALSLLCVFCVSGVDVDFLGMSVNSSAAIAGQWVLLVLGVVLLLATILLGYKYRKSKKRDRSLSMLELKQKD